MPALEIPGRAAPSNLRLPEGAKGQLIDSDLYNICDRVKEIDPNLFIVVLSDDKTHSFAIMEACKDGVDRLVYKVRELDGRVLDKLRYLAAKPLNERLEQLEKEEYRLKEQEHEAEMERLYYELGEPMKHQLVKDGFADRRSFYRKDPNRRLT